MKQPKTFKRVLKDLETGKTIELMTPLRHDVRTRKMFPNVSMMVMDVATFDKRIKDFETTIRLLVTAADACSHPDVRHLKVLRFNFEGWTCGLSVAWYAGNVGAVFLTEFSTTSIPAFEPELVE